MGLRPPCRPWVREGRDGTLDRLNGIEAAILGSERPAHCMCVCVYACMYACVYACVCAYRCRHFWPLPAHLGGVLLDRCVCEHLDEELAKRVASHLANRPSVTAELHLGNQRAVPRLVGGDGTDDRRLACPRQSVSQ